MIGPGPRRKDPYAIDEMGNDYLDKQDAVIVIGMTIALLIAFVGAPAYTSYKLGQDTCPPTTETSTDV